MSNTKLGVAAFAMSGLLLAGCGVAQVAGSATPISAPVPTAPESFMLMGTLTLTDALTADSSCLGQGDYADIRPGTGVTVRDAAGLVIGLGTLEASTSTPGRCFYPFSVQEVPAGMKFYSVEIARRGAFQYTEEEAGYTICLSLGD